MKKLVLVLIMLIVCSTASAEMWLWVDNATKEVKSFSNEDDARVDPDLYKLYKLPGDYKNYQLRYNPVYYKYINNNFVENIDMISAKENARIETEKKAAEYLEIKEEMEQMALKELEKKGKSYKYYKVKGE